MKKGFTLAEVLVTLGIIGVVSAMTVPTLMQNYQRKSYVTQLHKVYNELQQAFLQYQTDKNALNLKEAGLTNTNANSASDFMHKYFKTVNDCEGFRPCFAENYKSMNGAYEVNFTDSPLENYSCMIIASGASICISSIAHTEDGGSFDLGLVYVDVNGNQGPNIGGRDMHRFRYYEDGTIDIHLGTCDLSDKQCLKDRRESRFTSVCQTGGTSPYGDDCIGKLLNDNWEMNY